MKTRPTITGVHCTRFGELWEKSLYDLVRDAAEGALTDANIEIGQIDAIFYGNMLSGILDNNVHASGKISELLGVHVPVYRTEAACASGGMAFQMAYTYLQAFPGKTVLVLGAEKMTDFGGPQVTQALSAAASGEEQVAGLTFPGLYGMLAQTYLAKYGYTEEHLAHVAVKNHYHGTFNARAQFRKAITVEQVLKSPYVATPLKVLDSSPISDGACGLVLTNDAARISGRPGVAVLASEIATDTISLKGRKRLDGLDATVAAGDNAFATSGLDRSDISVAELHDCFTIAELLAMEDLGFWMKGEAGRHMADGITKLGSGGPLTVNTSGGLKASGHPVGATGIKQIGELYLQLTAQAGERQVADAKYGLAHNVGGSGGTAVVTILATI
jgi:acetyl-CoA C-acetyltransferase